MLHIHVLFIAPLCARNMTQPRAGQHQGGVPIWERPHHTGPAADLTVQPLDHIVGADTCPVLTGKVAVGQRLLDAVLDLFAVSFSFIALSSATTAFAFSREAFLLSCAWIALSIFATSVTLDLGTTEKTLR